jgi:hypothetical protein
MPANLTPQYLEADKRFKAARTTEEKVAVLEEMLALIPKHKGTEHLQGDLKRRLAKLRAEAEQARRRRGGFSASVEREGAGQVVLVGPPNTGKSALVKCLSNAQPEVGDGQHVETPEAECFHYCARIAFAGGAQADLIIAPDSGAEEETYEIHGAEYCIQIDHIGCVVRILERKADALSWKPGPEATSVECDGTLGEMEAFLAFLEAPRLRVPTLSDGLTAIRVAEAIAAGAERELPASGA